MNFIKDIAENFRPKVDAVIVQLVDDKPVISIECVNAKNILKLQSIAQQILNKLEAI